MIRLERRLFLAVVSAALLLLPACAEEDGTCKPECHRAATPMDGPGDTQGYFPAAVGWSWSYRVQGTGAPVSTQVTSADPVNGETVYVFMTYAAGYGATELVVKRPSGVYVLAEPSEEPPFDQLYPSLVLPFPVAVTPAAEQVRCSCLDLGDLDEDGKSDRAELWLTLQVFSVEETVGVPAGEFSNVAHVQTAAEVTVRASGGDSVTVDVIEDDWYARDVGRVFSRVWLGGPGLVPEEETLALESWTPGGGARPAAPAASPALRLARPPLEAAALELARRISRAGPASAGPPASVSPRGG